MRRRDFLVATLLGIAMPRAAAQSASTVKRVAMMHPATKPADMRIGGDATYTIIFEELKRLGYVEGVNLIVDRYSLEGRYDRLPEIAHEIVATSPNVITTMGPVAGVRIFQSETRTIPIVAWTGDPIAGRIISSLARPGGNVTGLSVQAGNIGGKPRGERLVASVPHGDWKTLTLVAALRINGLTAPYVIDGAMDGPSFLDYVEQMRPAVNTPNDGIGGTPEFVMKSARDKPAAHGVAKVFAVQGKTRYIGLTTGASHDPVHGFDDVAADPEITQRLFKARLQRPASRGDLFGQAQALRASQLGRA